MKKAPYLLAAMVLTGFASPAAAESWVYIYGEEDTWFFVDTDSKTSTFFWGATLEFTKPDTSVSRNKISYRCASREFKIDYLHVVDREGEVRISKAQPMPWSPAVPGTIMDAHLKYVCDGQIERMDNGEVLIVDDLSEAWKNVMATREE